MGYYSEVAWYIEGDQDKIDACMMAQRLECGELPEYMRGMLEQKPNLVSFYMDSGKWYDEFPGVIWCDKLLTRAEGMGLSGMFIRLGEEFDDNVTRTYGDDCSYKISINRSIFLDY